MKCILYSLFFRSWNCNSVVSRLLYIKDLKKKKNSRKRHACGMQWCFLKTKTSVCETVTAIWSMDRIGYLRVLVNLCSNLSNYCTLPRQWQTYILSIIVKRAFWDFILEINSLPCPVSFAHSLQTGRQQHDCVRRIPQSSKDHYLQTWRRQHPVNIAAQVNSTIDKTIRL